MLFLLFYPLTEDGGLPRSNRVCVPQSRAQLISILTFLLHVATNTAQSEHISFSQLAGAVYLHATVTLCVLTS